MDFEIFRLDPSLHKQCLKLVAVVALELEHVHELALANVARAAAEGLLAHLRELVQLFAVEIAGQAFDCG